MQAETLSKTDEVLARLRRNSDGVSFVEKDGTEWAQVYLDNAIPQGMSRHAFAGHLSALEKRGLYKPQGDDCFGDVKLA